jgi:RimJ/RimL family protein N-acetyltransferase
VDLPLPIETSRLRLRPLASEDFAAVHAIFSREDVNRWLYHAAQSEAEVRDMLERKIAWPRERGVTLAVELRASGELVGQSGLTVGPPEHRQGEIGFVFHPDHHGRGYATEAAEAVLGLAFEHYGLHRVCGRLEARNAASARVLERLGMRREAHLIENEWVKGAWESEVVYALLDREWREEARGWERRNAELWAAIDDLEPGDFLARIEALAAERPPGDGIAAFERAAANDSTGHPEQAAPLYREALAAGLEGERRRRAVIQLASTLRNLGDPEESVRLLTAERGAASDALDDAVVAVLALALADCGREREAAGLAIGALARHLPRYNRSMAAYAQDLMD